MKAVHQVEETQLEFSEQNNDSCKVDLLRNYLISQAPSVIESDISTLETNLSKLKTFPSYQGKQNEGLKGDGKPDVQYLSPLNPFAPDYVPFSTPKNAQFTIHPLEGSPFLQLQPSKLNRTTFAKDQEETTQKQTSSDVLERLAYLMTKHHAHEQLPLLEPETFSGDLLHYLTWKKSFDTIVDNRQSVSAPLLPWKKPDKIRIVFDATAEFKGESLNRHLLQGPDLTNSLNGVLCRFCEEPIAFTCGIEGMFHQVYVNPGYRNLLRFLWWSDGNIDSKPTEFRMTVHLFGAISSPGCANFALKGTAEDFEELFGSEPSTFVKEDFYVDDGLKSVPSAIQASALIESTKSLLAKGGFNPHKFISNSKEVIKAIPKDQQASGIKELDLSRDILPNKRLGILARIRCCITLKAANCVYNTVIKPILCYTDTVWVELSATSSKTLQRLQNRAARIVLWHDSSKDTFNVLGARNTRPCPPDQWCYVDTKENPADNASRGLGANELIRSNRWWNGPNFLWKPLPDEPNSDTQISPEDPEVQKVKALATNSIEHPSLLDRIKYFSDWYYAKRAIAVCLSFIQKMKLRINKDQGNSSWDESNPPQQDNGQKQQD
ncbi:hypothetical protein AWC38_SpisGene10529 [Stylophora pistillata]|uniref:Uncharacterized protein n=1 Tax=Stylophora pistillata TaxID=50429 RepID=A0A2B4S7U7_STYPI|nr:hypothetical protein AWC38_SpisGene10529 [Stylophora pistillata]